MSAPVCTSCGEPVQVGRPPCALSLAPRGAPDLAAERPCPACGAPLHPSVTHWSMTIDGVRYIADYKSTAGNPTKPYPEQAALQLAAYRWAKFAAERLSPPGRSRRGRTARSRLISARAGPTAGPGDPSQP